MSSPNDSSLGQTVAYPQRYDAALLFPIRRDSLREQIGVGTPLPFDGVDIWNAWEVSWLDARGKPQVAIGEFRVPADSPALVESKSLKLYLNSFNQERMESTGALVATLAKDLAAACGAEVGVRILEPHAFDAFPLVSIAGTCIDEAAVEIEHYHPDASLLRAGGAVVDESLYSNLLKSNCPVTGQPDWGSIQVRYRGPQIDHTGLLKYIVSFRQHDGFHEHCVETMFMDILNRCAPQALTLHARYTRRGGLDINPFRTNCGRTAPSMGRSARQ